LRTMGRGNEPERMRRKRAYGSAFWLPPKRRREADQALS
jgi:hypothetical protein